jgi:hypothetical protein
VKMRGTAISMAIAVVLGLGTPSALCVPKGERQRVSELRRERVALNPARVAIVPWTYIGGTPEAERAVTDCLRSILERAGFAVERVSHRSWFRDIECDLVESRRTLPDVKHLASQGHALGVDLVVAGSARWRSSTAWEGGVRVERSICEVDVIVVDVKRSRILAQARRVRMSGDETGTILTELAPVFDGKVPLLERGASRMELECRAGQLATARAMQPLSSARRRTTRPKV